MHHIGAAMGYGISLLAGYGGPSISSASLTSEFSSVSLNYKDMFSKQKDTPLGILNQLLFLINYTIFRVIFFPILCWRCALVTFLTWDAIGPFRAFCMCFVVFQACVMTALQFFWYQFIIKGLIRLIKGKDPEGAAPQERAQT